MKKRFSEEQIIGFLREAYAWKAKFGGMNVSYRDQLSQDAAQNAKCSTTGDCAK
jgi:hypothetical protein